MAPSLSHEWAYVAYVANSSDTAQHLLTAQQVQQLLHIDRSTIYRMASDGRLKSIRIGRQLRFPAGDLDLLLQGGHSVPGQQSLGRPEAATGPDPAVALGAIEVAADLLGVTMIVTDMAGSPLTAVVNPCTWFEDNLGTDAGVRDCIAEWRELAADPDLSTRFRTGQHGFECARALIRSGDRLIGMVLAGGIAPEGDAQPPDGLHHLPEAQRQAVLDALPRIAAAIGRADAHIHPTAPTAMEIP